MYRISSDKTITGPLNAPVFLQRMFKKALNTKSSDVFLWTPTHEYDSVSRQTINYLHLLCVVEKECSLEDLPGAMDGWYVCVCVCVCVLEGKREREWMSEREKSLLSAWLTEDDEKL